MLDINRNTKGTFTEKQPLYWHPLVNCWQELREMKKSQMIRTTLNKRRGS